MKRKIMMLVLSVALTLALIPTLAAYADDEFNQGGTPDTSGQIFEDSQGDEDMPNSDTVEEDATEEEDVVEEKDVTEEEVDLEEEDMVDVELPKINLKSPVTQLNQSDIGTQYTLIARVGAEEINPALVTWISDDESIATVSAEGVVTIFGVGKANFTAVMIDGTARNGYAKVFVLAEKAKPEAKNHNSTNADQDTDITAADKGGKKHK